MNKHCKIWMTVPLLLVAPRFATCAVPSAINAGGGYSQAQGVQAFASVGQPIIGQGQASSGESAFSGFAYLVNSTGFTSVRLWHLFSDD